MSTRCITCRADRCTYPGCVAGEIDRCDVNSPPRKPIAPGLLLDDEPARVYVSRAVLRIVARWAGAIALVGGAVGIMYAEGQRQPAPGVGFGIALALLMGAALLLPLGRSNDG